MQRGLSFIMISITLFSCGDIIEVPDISNETVVLLAPTDNAVLNISNVFFDWEAFEEAEYYHIQLATPTFTGAQQIVADSTVTSTNFQINLDAGIYQWRLRAENSGYETEYTTYSLVIED